ncbi:hypothetical protein GOAMR_61_00590 [Gordonia amarae NBRC 15530]|uniref:Uncharacterized protein n=1 Tax=Gordonia amarae NBRC 15530 TaxID=1075090 RepID=G7GTN8_9ACTN|nr:hypothetical protein GOAMR_61_00590 [Gordonia amarae NBRC 15530]
MSLIDVADQGLGVSDGCGVARVVRIQLAGPGILGKRTLHLLVGLRNVVVFDAVNGSL